MSHSKVLKRPKWVNVLRYLVSKALTGEWVSNEEMAKDLGGGYYARNYLNKRGEIIEHGLKIIKDTEMKKGYTLYRLHPDSIEQANRIIAIYP